MTSLPSHRSVSPRLYQLHRTGCDLSHLPDGMKTHPSITNIKVGDYVIVYCETPPYRTEIVVCTGHNSITAAGEFPVVIMRGNKPIKHTIT